MRKAKSKSPAPGEEGLITRIECRVSRWFGIRFLSAIPLYSLFMWLATSLDSWMSETFGLATHRNIWMFLAVAMLALATERLYIVLWMRTVAVYDRGDQVAIQVNNRLYQFPWTDLRKVRTYQIRTRARATYSINLVVKFKGRTFRMSSSDEHMFTLETLAETLRQRLDAKDQA